MDPSSTFYVLSNNGTPVAAQFLNYNNAYVVDPNQQNVQLNPKLQIYQYNLSGDLVAVANANPNNYLIVPDNFSVDSAEAYANRIEATLNGPSYDIGSGLFTALQEMVLSFAPTMSQDLQRNYDGVIWNGNSGMFVNAFTSAASWYLGFVAQQSGIGTFAAITGGGLTQLSGLRRSTFPNALMKYA